MTRTLRIRYEICWKKSRLTRQGVLFEMRTYTTRQGDTWDLIAYQQMGSCEHTKLLMWSNRLYLRYYIFPAGIVITIPDSPIPENTTAPPWKKVTG